MSKRSSYFTRSLKRKYSIESLKNDDPEQQSSRKQICNVVPSPSCVMLSLSERKRLEDCFFNQESSNLARALLGKVLVRRFDSPDGSQLVCGRIVETEAYLGVIDKAAHSYNYKRTARTEATFMKPGTVNIYFIYGMYYCMNVSSNGEGAAVLLRAIEPLTGMEQMGALRRQRRNSEQIYKTHQLCNGPSKLCLAFGIDGQFDRIDLVAPSSPLWMEEWGPETGFDIVISRRIGLGKKAEEWTQASLRFYIKGCKSVSVIDRLQEKNLSKQIVALNGCD